MIGPLRHAYEPQGRDIAPGSKRAAPAFGRVVSMGSIGDCYDNAMIEAFWGRMQTELLNRKRWKTRIELANAIFDYLEIFHNRQTAPLRPRHAHSDKVRTATSIRPTRGLKTKYGDTTEPRAHHLQHFQGGSDRFSAWGQWPALAASCHALK